MNLVGILMPFLIAFAVLVVLSRLIAGSADAERKALETESGRLDFVPNRRSYWGVYIFLACMAYAFLASLVHGLKTGLGLGQVGFIVGFALLLLAAFPGSISIDDDGLGQYFWLRGEKRIAWKDVKAITVDEKKREIKVIGKAGVKVLHARQLPDRERFLEELKKHCAGKVPGEQALKATSGI
jgi:hypothetical protein